MEHNGWSGVQQNAGVFKSLTIFNLTGTPKTWCGEKCYTEKAYNNLSLEQYP